MATPQHTIADEISDSIAAQVQDLVGDACLSLFRDYQIALQIVAPIDQPELEAVAIIGFTSAELRGALGLAASQPALREFAQKAGVQGDDLDDWLGELANQLLGRLKNQLLRYRIELFMATPMTLRGLRLQIRSQETNHILSCHFRTQSGSVCVWLDLRVQPGLELVPSEDPEHQCQDEGELLFF